MRGFKSLLLRLTYQQKLKSGFERGLKVKYPVDVLRRKSLLLRLTYQQKLKSGFERGLKVKYPVDVLRRKSLLLRFKNSLMKTSRTESANKVESETVSPS